MSVQRAEGEGHSSYGLTQQAWVKQGEIMHWFHYHFVGMHVFWWMFWILLIIPFFWIATPVRRKTVHLYRDNPFGILQRRYAAGELSSDEYEARKARIKQDLQDLGDPELLQVTTATPADSAS